MKLNISDHLRLLSKGDFSFLKAAYSTPVIIGEYNFKVEVKQRPGLLPTSHCNMVIIQAQQSNFNKVALKCDVRWSRVNKYTEQFVQEGELYTFSIDDAGWVLKGEVSVEGQSGKAVVLLGPIIIDPSARLALQNVINAGGSKFPLTVRSLQVHGSDGLSITNAKDLNYLLTVYLTSKQLKFVNAKEKQTCVEYSTHQPQLHVVGERNLQMEFSDVLLEDALQVIQMIIPQRYERVGSVIIELEASTSSQKDLFVMSTRLLAQKNTLETHKLNETINRYLQENRALFSESPYEFSQLRLPGDMLLQNQMYERSLRYLVEKNRELESEAKKCKNQVKAFEAEMQDTIQAYQELLNQHNIAHLMGNVNMSIRSSDLIGNLKQQIEVLKEQNLDITPMAYTGETKEQLMVKLNDLNQKLAKSRRLNELLNEELKMAQQSSPQILQQEPDDYHQLRAEIEQLKLENEMVHAYHKQIVEQEIMIKELNQRLQSQNQTLMNSSPQFDFRQTLDEPNDYQEKLELLEEQNRVLQRKNESLLKEIDLLINSPNQIRILQNQVAQNQIEKQLGQLQQQVQQLREENSALKDQNQLIQQAQQMRTSSRQKSEQGSPMYVRQRSAGSQHSINTPKNIFSDLPPKSQIKAGIFSQNRKPDILPKPIVFDQQSSMLPIEQPPPRAAHSQPETVRSSIPRHQQNQILKDYENLINGKRY